VIQAILRRSRIEELTGLSRSTIYELMENGKFPRPISIGAGRAVGWLEDEILQWQNARIAARDGAQRKAQQ
jgi:prophage regulatory protein